MKSHWTRFNSKPGCINTISQLPPGGPTTSHAVVEGVMELNCLISLLFWRNVHGCFSKGSVAASLCKVQWRSAGRRLVGTSTCASKSPRQGEIMNTAYFPPKAAEEGCIRSDRLGSELNGLEGLVAKLKQEAIGRKKGVHSFSPHVEGLLERILRECEERGWGEINSGLLVRIVSSTVKWKGGLIGSRNALLDAVVAEATEASRLEEYTSLQLTSLIHSIGLLGPDSAEVFSRVMKEGHKVQRLRSMDPTGFAVLVYSMGAARFESERCLENVLKFSPRPKALSQMTTQGLCMVMTGLERLGIPDHHVMLSVLREATIPTRLASMNPQDVLGLLHACGRAKLYQDSYIMVGRIIACLLDKGFSHLPNRDFVNILRGIALCKYREVDALEQFYAEIGANARMSSYEPKDLSSLCWVMATIGVYKSQLFETLVARYQETVDLHSKIVEYQIGVGQIVHACAQFRHKNLPLFQSIWSAMMDNPKVDPFQFAQFSWMLCVVGCLQQDQCSKISSRLQRKVYFRTVDLDSKYSQFCSEVYVHIRSQGWESECQGHLYRSFLSPVYVNGLHEEPTPNKFVNSIGICLKSLEVGCWYVRLWGMIHGYVFGVPKRAVLLPLQYSFYVHEMEDNLLALRGQHTAKMEWLRRDGYKITTVPQRQWEKEDEQGQQDTLRMCIRHMGVPCI